MLIATVHYENKLNEERTRNIYFIPNYLKEYSADDNIS